MNHYLNGTDVKLRVPLVDPDGNAISVSAIDYRVTDALGAEMVATTALAGFTANDPEAVITVPAVKNTLATGQRRDLRVVELICTTDDNKIVLRGSYAISQADPLVVGVNSFQSYPAARFIALGIPNIIGWNNASDDQRIAALIDAREHICQLNFQAVTSRRGQNYLDSIPEGETDIGSNLFGFNGDLKLLGADQFMRLPTEFLTALRKAQVAEANVILGGDPTEAKRQDGLLMDAVGESRQMFRPTKPLQLPVSRRALAYLSQFATLSKRVGRA